MITKEFIERINYLAAKQRDGGLTKKEKEEQKELREIYLQNIRSQIVDALESAGFKPGKKHDGECVCRQCGREGENADQEPGSLPERPGPGAFIRHSPGGGKINIKAVLFDLGGTLLSMDKDIFSGHQIIRASLPNCPVF